MNLRPPIQAHFNVQRRSTVSRSGSPAKPFCKASLKILFSELVFANKVIEDRNFKSSRYPKTWLIERPSTSITSRVHSLKRGPVLFRRLATLRTDISLSTAWISCDGTGPHGFRRACNRTGRRGYRSNTDGQPITPSEVFPGHRAVTSQISRRPVQNIQGRSECFGSRVPRGLCGWCREGETNPQDPKVGGF